MNVRASTERRHALAKGNAEFTPGKRGHDLANRSGLLLVIVLLLVLNRAPYRGSAK